MSGIQWQPLQYQSANLNFADNPLPSSNPFDVFTKKKQEAEQASMFQQMQENQLNWMNQFSEMYQNQNKSFMDMFGSMENRFNGLQQNYSSVLDIVKSQQEFNSNILQAFSENRPIESANQTNNPTNIPTENSNANYAGVEKDRLIFKNPNYTKHSPMISRLAQENGIDPANLLAFGFIESGFDNGISKAGSSYGGLFQINKSQHKNWQDPEYNTKEAIKLYKSNEKYFKSKFGKDAEFTAGHAYLYHQQGMGGATALLDPKNADKPASEVLMQFKYNGSTRSKDWIAENVIKANGVDSSKMKTITAKEFADRWITRGNNVKTLFNSNANNVSNNIPNMSQNTPYKMNTLEEYSKEKEDIKGQFWDKSYNFGMKHFGSFLPTNQQWRINSGFGKRNIPNGSIHHRGYDLNTPIGTAINSPFENAIIKNVYTDKKGGGNVIELYDPISKNTVQFLHMDRFGKFKKNDKVTSKDIIGYTGNSSGNPNKTYGAHLDLRVYDQWGRYLSHNGKTINSKHYRRN